MQHTPQQLKEKLLNSLDKNNHVVDMQGALEVITNLERNPISRHALESTRLGRMVNELRKNTHDRDLARRAKNLVRQWQELVSQSTPTSASPQSQTSSPALHPLALAPVRADTPIRAEGSNGVKSYESVHPKVVSGPSSLLRVKSSGYIGSADSENSRSVIQSSSRQLSPGMMSFSKTASSKQTTPGTGTSRDGLSNALPRPTTIFSKISTPQNTLGVSPTPTNSSLSLSHTAAYNQRSSNPNLALSDNGLRSDSTQSCTKSQLPNDASMGNGSVRATPAVPDLKASGFLSNPVRISTSPPDAHVPMASNPSSGVVKFTTTSNHRHSPSESQGFNVRAIDSCTLGHVSAPRKLPGSTQSLSSTEAVSQISSIVEEPSTFSVSRISKKRRRSGSPGGLKLKIKKSRIVDESVPGGTDIVPVATKKPVGRPRKIINGVPNLDQNHAICNNASVASDHKMKIDFTSVDACGSTSSMSAYVPRTIVSAERKGNAKVATTAELIQKLHAKGELRLVASDTLERIATNKIVREVDIVNPSVVNVKSAHSKHGKKELTATNSSDDAVRNITKSRQAADAMKRIKTEMVHKFLDTAVSENERPYAGEGSRDFGRPTLWPEPEPERSGLLDLIEHLDPVPLPEEIIAASTIIRIKPVVKPEEQIKHLVVPKVEAKPGLDDPWSRLPVLDPESIDWESLDYEAPPIERPPVTSADVDRVCTERWVGVNGQWVDGSGGWQWKDWTEMFSVESSEGSLLHILPYVDITD